MITVRKSTDRGHFDFGWLNTYHTFSFGEYYDPRHMGFRSLRVINEDLVQPGGGFPTHPHRDMEIISYVVAGGLAHKDSMGNGSTIKPGEVQRMSAGTGVYHSEFNHSKDEVVHLLQIWLQPAKKGIKPGYEQKFFSDVEKQGKLRLVASPDGSEGSVTINQDVKLYATLLQSGQKVEFNQQPDRHLWIQVVHGSIELNGKHLEQSDGAAISGEQTISLLGKDAAEVLIFDLA